MSFWNIISFQLILRFFNLINANNMNLVKSSAFYARASAIASRVRADPPPYSDLRPQTLLFAFLLSPLAAATLSLDKTPSGFTLTTPQNSAVYYYLQQSTDLQTFYPFSMALGDTATQWSMAYEAQYPSRFFTALGISVYAPRDTDGDYIDDIYELRHPFLDPLNPNDALALIPSKSITYLDEYRQIYGLSAAAPQIYSREVSAFNFGAAYESAVSREITAFNFGAPVFSVEAHSREMTVFNGAGGPAQGEIPEVYSREISAYNFGAPPFSLEAHSREITVFNGDGGPAQGEIPEIYSREVSLYNDGAPVHTIEAISREVSLFNDIN